MLSTRPDDTFFLNCRVCQRFIGSSGLCLWLVGLGTKCPFCLWCCNLTSSMAMALFQDWQDLWMAYKQSGLSPTAVIFLAMAGDSWGYRGPPVFAIRDGTSRKWPSLFMWPLAYCFQLWQGDCCHKGWDFLFVPKQPQSLSELQDSAAVFLAMTRGCRGHPAMS